MRKHKGEFCKKTRGREIKWDSMYVSGRQW
jgi:hypothetical protein